MKELLTNLTRAVLGSRKAVSPRSRRRAPLTAEALEDRLVPSAALLLALPVTSHHDSGGVHGVYAAGPELLRMDVGPVTPAPHGGLTGGTSPGATGPGHPQHGTPTGGDPDAGYVSPSGGQGTGANGSLASMFPVDHSQPGTSGQDSPGSGNNLPVSDGAASHPDGNLAHRYY